MLASERSLAMRSCRWYGEEVLTHLETSPRPLTPRQRRILEAATEVFAERGFEGATTAEIARRAGVSEGSIFKRFKTKNDLLMAVVGPYLWDVGAPGMLRIMGFALADPSSRLDEVLRAIAVDRLAFIRSHPAVIRILLQEVPFRPELVAALAGEIEPSVALVERFQRSGEIDPELPAPTAGRIIFSTVGGYLLARLLVPQADWDDEREIEHTVRVLVRGLAP
jgi:AcrR family transcriptional regulator